MDSAEANTPDTIDLSEEQKQRLDRILQILLDFSQTEQGRKLAGKIQIWKEAYRSEKKPALNKREEKVLKYIVTELASGRTPSVRDITAAAGLRSSRSGYLIIRALEEKGYVQRKDGQLVVSKF